MSANPAFSNVAVRCDGNMTFVSWQTRDARFHFILYNGATEYTNGTLYKNSLAKHNEVGFFQTRRLDGTKAANEKIIRQVMDIVRAHKLITKAREKRAEDQAAFITDLEKRGARRAHAIKLFDGFRKLIMNPVNDCNLSVTDMTALLEFAPKGE